MPSQQRVCARLGGLPGGAGQECQSLGHIKMDPEESRGSLSEQWPHTVTLGPQISQSHSLLHSG